MTPLQSLSKPSFPREPLSLYRTTVGSAVEKPLQLLSIPSTISGLPGLMFGFASSQSACAGSAGLAK